MTNTNTATIATTALAAIKWNTDGLVPVIAQDTATGKVLMLAWMNQQALQESISRGEAVYWSRSRQKLWHKGESSGHVQKIESIHLDCDNDALLLQVQQIGGIACHTGRHNCFFQELKNQDWLTQEPIIKDPNEIYSS